MMMCKVQIVSNEYRIMMAESNEINYFSVTTKSNSKVTEPLKAGVYMVLSFSSSHHKRNIRGLCFSHFSASFFPRALLR